jgi:alkylated DNA nucleotide flippase Atl1
LHNNSRFIAPPNVNMKPAGADLPLKTQQQSMAKPKSKAFARIRAEVIRLVGLIPPGKFTTYGSIAIHMNVVARHVAFVMSSLTEQEAAELPWHRVVSRDARLSPNMTRLSRRYSTGVCGTKG